MRLERKKGLLGDKIEEFLSESEVLEYSVPNPVKMITDNYNDALTAISLKNNKVTDQKSPPPEIISPISMREPSTPMSIDSLNRDSFSLESRHPNIARRLFDLTVDPSEDPEQSGALTLRTIVSDTIKSEENVLRALNDRLLVQQEELDRQLIQENNTLRELSQMQFEDNYSREFQQKSQNIELFKRIEELSSRNTKLRDSLTKQTFKSNKLNRRLEELKDTLREKEEIHTMSIDAISVLENPVSTELERSNLELQRISNMYEQRLNQELLSKLRAEESLYRMLYVNQDMQSRLQSALQELSILNEIHNRDKYHLADLQMQFREKDEHLSQQSQYINELIETIRTNVNHNNLEKERLRRLEDSLIKERAERLRFEGLLKEAIEKDNLQSSKLENYLFEMKEKDGRIDYLIREINFLSDLSDANKLLLNELEIVKNANIDFQRNIEDLNNELLLARTPVVERVEVTTQTDDDDAVPILVISGENNIAEKSVADFSSQVNFLPNIGPRKVNAVTQTEYAPNLELHNIRSKISERINQRKRRAADIEQGIQVDLSENITKNSGNSVGVNTEEDISPPLKKRESEPVMDTLISIPEEVIRTSARLMNNFSNRVTKITEYFFRDQEIELPSQGLAESGTFVVNLTPSEQVPQQEFMAPENVEFTFQQEPTIKARPVKRKRGKRALTELQITPSFNLDRMSYVDLRDVLDEFESRNAFDEEVTFK